MCPLATKPRGMHVRSPLLVLTSTCTLTCASTLMQALLTLLLMPTSACMVTQALFTCMTSTDKCVLGDAGIALRVPTPNVSVVDLVIQTEKKTFAEEVNEAFRDYSQNKGKVSCILT